MEITDRHAGHVISERLEALGKTQTWLARESGVSNNAVTKWIRTGQITRHNAARAAELLSVPIHELFKELAPSAPPALKAKIESSAAFALCWVSPEELELLTAYRLASPEGRKMIDLVARNAPKEGRRPN